MRDQERLAAASKQHQTQLPGHLLQKTARFCFEDGMKLFVALSYKASVKPVKTHTQKKTNQSKNKQTKSH